MLFFCSFASFRVSGIKVPHPFLPFVGIRIALLNVLTLVISGTKSERRTSENAYRSFSQLLLPFACFAKTSDNIGSSIADDIHLVTALLYEYGRHIRLGSDQLAHLSVVIT